MRPAARGVFYLLFVVLFAGTVSAFSQNLSTQKLASRSQQPPNRKSWEGQAKFSPDQILVRFPNGLGKCQLTESCRSAQQW
jgi:hypothetical protein